MKTVTYTVFTAMKAAIMGAMFLMFLPAVGFILVGYALVLKALAPLSKLATPAPLTPGEAYLTGTPPSDKASAEPADILEDLAQEIEKKRQ